MKNWYSYILFYRYPGESITRAFAFNNPKQATAAIRYGAVVIEVLKATSRARNLCTEVTLFPDGMPVSILRQKMEDSNPGDIRPVNWRAWLKEHPDMTL